MTMNAGVFQRIRASLAEECVDSQIEASLKRHPLSVHSTSAYCGWQQRSARELLSRRVEPISTHNNNHRYSRKNSNSQGERSVEKQIESLFAHERKMYEEIKSQWENLECFDELSKKWVHVKRNVEFSDEMYLLFSRCNNFEPARALEQMERFDTRYLSLTCSSLETQLLTKTLFVVPGLETISGLDVFYMRPSRYFPRRTPTPEIIDNLIYVMQTMQTKEKNCTDGIAFLANMNGWRKENFSVGYAHAFMNALQGHYYPVRVSLFLIVDPPNWFGLIWDALSQVLSAEFSKKVHIIYSDDLDKYLQPGYHQYLPDDFGGKSRTAQIVSDFVAQRKALEGSNNDKDYDSIGISTRTCAF
eukprot:CAMPEP_0197442480 /NCGR_PEP_ID=MMETSP1175-20131217/8488_1 /TAXON_ID=1003142 /ORGANISM="Triceratium dubium, Strain CCMP147" /LENGTH=358 /DNA_ID=CAMNT_0042972963 /DNA_START=45 /DNA_END=1121 /DNA_ORIENTATION=-